MQYLDNIIECIKIATQISIPKFNKKNHLIGWGRYVKVFKDQSIFWTNIWKELGSPNLGIVYNIKNSCRKKYHSSIKFIKKNREALIKNRIAKTLKDKSHCNFWREINKIKLRNKTTTNVMDGVIGHVDITHVFKDKYQQLYNEFHNDQPVILDKISADIGNKCEKSRCNLLTHNISQEDVQKTIKELKKNKYEPIYEISSNNFKNGTDNLNFVLSRIFNSILIHGCSNDKINKSKIISIIKNKRKSASNSDNYRGISLSTIMSKMLEILILNKVEKLVVCNDFQFGFRKDHSTSLCVSAFQQTVKYYLNGNSSVFCVFLDASKAFDRINHNKLFTTLLQTNICPLYIRLLYFMYLHNNAVVGWSGCISEPFRLTNGVKQGGILSPLLFSIYLDALLLKVQSSKVGCHIGQLPCNIFSYADDLVLVAPTVKSINLLLRNCIDYSIEFGLKFNPDKTKYMGFSNHYLDFDCVNILFNNIKVEHVSQFKYLGFNIEDVNFSYSSKIVNNELKIKTNTICSNFRCLDTESRINIFNSQCLSLYGGCLWDLQNPEIDKLEISWRKCSRQILEVPYRTHNYLIPSLMGTPSLKNILQQRFLNFFVFGINHDNESIAYIFKNSLFAQNSQLLRQLNIILNSHGIPYFKIFKKAKIKLKLTTFINGK